MPLAVFLRMGRVVTLPPGEYRVTYQKSRFKKIVYEGAKVEVGKTITMNVTMQIADIEDYRKR